MSDTIETPREKELRANIRRMLTMHAGEPEQCSGCGRDIWKITMKKTGKLNPMTDEAISHFVDCPKAAEFRKGGK